MAWFDVFAQMKERYTSIYPTNNSIFPGGFTHILSDSSGSGRETLGSYPRAVWVRPGPRDIRFYEKSLNKTGSFQDRQLYTATYSFNIELWLPNDGANEESRSTPIVVDDVFRDRGLVNEYISELKRMYPGNGCRIISGGYMPTDGTTVGEVYILEVEMDFSVFEKLMQYQPIEEVALDGKTVTT